MAKKRCFVISPIGEEGSGVREHADDVFRFIIEPAVKKFGIEAVRSDHIHETGDLTEGCKSLCAHYNPFNKTHGGPNDKNRHVGDLGNITANDKGVAKIRIFDNLVKLKGKYSVLGRSIVIHEDEDDLGKGDNKECLITGNAGKRIGCGVIGYAKC